MKSILLISLSLLLMAAKSTPPVPHFFSYDINGNGAICPFESKLNPILKRQFSVLDVDNDGELTQDEYTLFRG